MELEVKLIVGLEIHVQLATRTKLFCGCRLAFADPPNSNVCPVCLGLPGSLPVMNKTAYEYSVQTALSLNCTVADFTKWDRKSYYYPDLPKNYQISQYDLPLGHDGYLDVPIEGGQTKRIRILRAHLEEDAGKNLHEGLDHSQVDLNRTGTPLLEIVTQPDLSSAEECGAMARELQRLVRFIGVSQADMQKGHMRFEPNINLHITDTDGREYKTPIIEVKNLNSFRALEGAVAHEQWRQLQAWKKDHDYTLSNHSKQNRGWNDARKETVFQREKEEANEYRYFPEPDLVPVEMDAAWLESLRARVGELPLAMKQRFMTHYGLSEYDSDVLTSDPEIARAFDRSVMSIGPARQQARGTQVHDWGFRDPARAKRIANLYTQRIFKLCNEEGITFGELGISSERLGQVDDLVEEGTLSTTGAGLVVERMRTDDRDPQTIAKQANLVQKSDAGELAALLDEVLAQQSQAVEEVRSGGKKAKKARGFLLGQVMQKTKGQANPQVVGQLLDEKLGQD